MVAKDLGFCRLGIAEVKILGGTMLDELVMSGKYSNVNASSFIETIEFKVEEIHQEISIRHHIMKNRELYSNSMLCLVSAFDLNICPLWYDSREKTLVSSIRHGFFTMPASCSGIR